MLYGCEGSKGVAGPHPLSTPYGITIWTPFVSNDIWHNAFIEAYIDLHIVNEPPSPLNFGNFNSRALHHLRCRIPRVCRTQCTRRERKETSTPICARIIEPTVTEQGNIFRVFSDPFCPTRCIDYDEHFYHKTALRAKSHLILH